MKTFLKSLPKPLTVFFLTVSLMFSSVSPALATTLTPSSAKRDAPGPFAAGVMGQGNWNSPGYVDDITFPLGTQISGDFYSNLDLNQGSIVLWVTPEWNGNDGKAHYFLDPRHTDSLLFKNVYNQLVFANKQSTAKVVVSTTTWTAGTTYLIVARWDSRNTFDGSNYLSLSVNDTSVFGGTTAFSMTSYADIPLGSYTGTQYPANALIEGLTIYRRPLFDGTYGIDVGNGDEIASIYNSGSGQDPTLVTGSWDVVFDLPTNASTGALSTGTGEAWSHPHSSNLLYTDTTNTGGFMMNGTYTNDGWSDEGTPTSVSALATSEKIFAGGYKTVSDAANEGIYQDITVSAGDDWVVRALANSDGTSVPKIILYDQTNGAEIGSLTGTTTSTRTAPDVFIFTGEAPTGSTTLRVKLINTASTGTTYWHQVEVLSNLITNPSMETGSGDPWIPTGWTNQGLDAGDSVQQTTTIHSGGGSFEATSGAVSETVSSNNLGSLSTSSFYMAGGWVNIPSGSGSVDPNSPLYYQHSSTQQGPPDSVINTNGGWSHVVGIGRYRGYGANYSFWFGGGNGSRYVDDVYFFPLTDVSLTVTPASEANSTENTDEIRVDGRDSYVETSASSIGTDSGYVSFDYRPRHSAADAVKWAETTSDDAYIITLYADADDYVKVYWDSANTIKMDYSIAGTTDSGTWDATGAITSNSQYAVVLQYTGGSTMTLKVGGTTRITLSNIPSAFGTAPNTVYFGSDTSGANQGDATFSNIVFDNTPPSLSLSPLSPDPSNDNTPSVGGTATEAIGTVSNVQYQMDGTAGSWTACTADDGAFDEASEDFTCTPSSLSDGSHTIYVRATDSNSNTTASGSESSDAFTIDATAPAISVTTHTPDPGNDSTPSIAGTATDATTVLTAIEFQMDSTSGSWTTCTADDGTIDETSETFTCTPSALSDGSHTIYIRATDNATNTTSLANYGSDSFVVDTVSPSLSLTAISPDPGTDTTPTLTGTATDGTTVLTAIEFQVDSTSGSWTTCTADDGAIDEISEAFTCSVTSALSDGSHTLYVRTTDNAGNTSSTASDAFTIDTSAPTKTTFNVNNNDRITTQRLVTLTIDASDVLSGVTEMLISESSDFSGANWEAYATAKSWTLVTGDGTKTVYIKFKDTAGNESGTYQDTILLDTTGPVGEVLINSGASTTTSEVVTLTLSASDTDGVSQMIISGSSNFSDANWEDYTQSKIITFSDTPGQKDIYVKFKDTSGNESSIYEAHINLDPSKKILLINSDAVFTTSRLTTLTISPLSVFPNAVQMSLSESSDFAGASFEPFVSTKPLRLSEGDGTKTVYIKFLDNLDRQSAVYQDTIALDTTPPSLSLTTIGDLPYSASRNSYYYTGLNPLFFGTGEKEALITLKVDGVDHSYQPLVNNQGEWSIGNYVFSVGTHTLQLTAKDKAGNQSLISLSLVIDPSMDLFPQSIRGSTNQVTPTPLLTLTPSTTVEQTPPEQITPTVSLPAGMVGEGETPGIQGNTLTIRLFDQSGNPLVGVKVTLASKIQTAVTNQKGEATFEKVPPGEHTLSFNYKGSQIERVLNLLNDEQNFKVDVKVTEEGGSLWLGIPLWGWGVIAGLGLITILSLYLVVRKRSPEVEKLSKREEVEGNEEK